MGMSTIKGMGTGREDRFTGGMNIIKYSTFPVEEVAYFHLSCGGSCLFSPFLWEGVSYFHLSCGREFLSCRGFCLFPPFLQRELHMD